jgi:DNA-binding response OmpR family regulator
MSLVFRLLWGASLLLPESSPFLRVLMSPTAEARPLTNIPPEKRPRVLVVDDDKRLANALCVVLNQHGFDTSVAYSGAKAIETALISRPDFILMDVMMKKIDGVDAAIAICELLPRCRILLMSGAEDAIQKLEKGAKRGHQFELMMKPVLAASLLEKLQS